MKRTRRRPTGHGNLSTTTNKTLSPVAFQWETCLDGYQILPGRTNEDELVLVARSRTSEPYNPLESVPRHLTRRQPGKRAIPRRDPRDAFLDFAKLQDEGEIITFATLWGLLGIAPTTGSRPLAAQKIVDALGAKMRFESVIGEPLAGWFAEIDDLRRAIELYLAGKVELLWNVINAKFRTASALRPQIQFVNGNHALRPDSLLGWLWMEFADKCHRHWSSGQCRHCGADFVVLPRGNRPPRGFCNPVHKSAYAKRHPASAPTRSRRRAARHTS